MVENILTPFITNPFIIVGTAWLFVLGFDILIFLKNVKRLLKEKEQTIMDNLKNKYGSNNLGINDTIEVINTVRELRMDLYPITNMYDINLGSGIFILIGCLIGVINQPAGFGILVAGSIFFVISFLFLIYWQAKKS